ncbi:heme exporter protein CcmD [Roseateles sp. BYS96W]|uniref:Heme exporter protein D n=1 Tax=Pelomonas nitida TaxID=3299027 RepID=A0ABW7GC24_9BURK
MQWNSAREFFLMGGYAFYVWGSVGACALAMLAEPWLIRRQRQAIERALRASLDAAADEVPRP